MPYIPHTEVDVKEMLAAIGVGKIDDLFGELPQELRAGAFKNIPEGINEPDVLRLLKGKALIIPSKSPVIF